MYARNTILTRREPFEVPNPEADPPVEGDPKYIFNRVRVVGTSPISHMGGTATWSGVGAQGVIIEPLDGFGGTVDRPLGELQRDYTIESEPGPTKIEPSIRVVNSQTREAGPSPEEIFAETASVKEETAPRRRRRRS
jgi:hypothetical protein